MDTPRWSLEEVCTPVLAKQLDRLSGWIKSELGAPSWKEILLVEGFLDHSRRISLKGWTPENYERRFTEHMKAGYSWINLHAMGILRSTLVASIELSPGGPTGSSTTQVILSGPSHFVTERRGWELDEFLSIEGAA
jgi:hypothetical protein